jgi:hypothetical protein
MKIFSKIIPTLILAFFISAADAQTKTWSRIFGFNAGTDTDKNDFVTSVMPHNLNNPGYLLVGTSNSFLCCSNNIYFMLLNQNGSIGLQKMYDTGQNDGVTWIERIIDGYILVGTSIRDGNQDAWIMKVNKVGNILWQKFIGSEEADVFTGVKKTSDGEFIVLGETRSTATKNWATWIVKFSESGELLWQKSYDSGKSGAHYSLALAPGGFIIAGPNFATVRFDNSGNILWAKSYGGPKYDQAFGIVQAPERGFILTGSTVSFGKGSRNLWIVRINSSGNILWQKAIGSKGSQDGHAIIKPFFGGGNIIAGRTDSDSAGNFDGFLVRIDRNGNIQWQRTYGGALSDSFNSVHQAPDGGYIVGGYTRSFEATKFDAWVLKLDENGILYSCPKLGNFVSMHVENSNAVATNRTRSELPISTQILDREFTEFDLGDAGPPRNNCRTD